MSMQGEKKFIAMLDEKYENLEKMPNEHLIYTILGAEGKDMRETPRRAYTYGFLMGIRAAIAEQNETLRLLQMKLER